jgi:predicted dehydrogenase
VREGRLGEITLVRGAFSFLLDPSSGFRLTPEMGGGCLWDVGVYPLSFSQWVMGEKPMHVKGEQRLGQSGVDVAFAGQLHYAGDRMAQIYAGFCTPRYTSAEIIGTEGRLILNRPFIELNDGTAEVLVFPGQGRAQEIPVPDEYLYMGEFNDMHAAILDGETPFWTLRETRDLLETVLALKESAQTGRVVSLNQVAS